MKVWPESVRWRLTLWYAALLAVPLVSFAVGSRYLLEEVLMERGDTFMLEARNSFMAEFTVELHSTPAPKAAKAAMHDVRFHTVMFAVFDGNDTLIAVTNQADSTERPLMTPMPELLIDRASLLALRDNRHPKPNIVTYDAGDTTYRVVIGKTVLRNKRYTIAAVQSLEPIYNTLSSVTLAYFIAIPSFLLIAIVGGYVLARRALSPVAVMSRQARVIGATNLHERLPVRKPQDELGELATMINELLQRLEWSFEQQRRFVANASHELRTPVAIVRAESEIALGRTGRPESEYRDSLEVVHDAADRMSRIVQDLFLLARADAGHMPTQPEPLYLDEVVTDVARSMRGVAAQSGINIDVGPMPEAPFEGDVELLGRMLLNLLDNAVKYSPPQSTVHVSLGRDNGDYRLSVRDEGEGIPADAQPHVFERFFRADKSRTRANGTKTSGAGLGLAIVQLVAEAHGGHAELTRSTSGGSEFAVTLPAHS